MAEQRKKLEIDLNITGKDAQEMAASPNPEAWLKAYLRKKYNLPANAELDLSGLHVGPAQQESEAEPPDLVVEQLQRIEAPGYNELGEDEPYYSPPDEEEEYISGDGSGLHQCPYCYDQVYEEHEEFCRLNPHRNRNIVP